MILLSFTTAAKYVLSMMLAVLGIIPFEDIEVPNHNPAATELSFMNMEKPLLLDDSKTLWGKSFSTTDIDEFLNPVFIPSREDYEFELNTADNREEYSFVQCTVTTEEVEVHKECGTIIIYIKEKETKTPKENILLLNYNI